MTDETRPAGSAVVQSAVEVPQKNCEMLIDVRTQVNPDMLMLVRRAASEVQADLPTCVITSREQLEEMLVRRVVTLTSTPLWLAEVANGYLEDVESRTAETPRAREIVKAALARGVWSSSVRTGASGTSSVTLTVCTGPEMRRILQVAEEEREKLQSDAVAADRNPGREERTMIDKTNLGAMAASQKNCEMPVDARIQVTPDMLVRVRRAARELQAEMPNDAITSHEQLVEALVQRVAAPTPTMSGCLETEESMAAATSRSQQIVKEALARGVWSGTMWGVASGASSVILGVCTELEMRRICQAVEEELQSAAAESKVDSNSEPVQEEKAAPPAPPAPKLYDGPGEYYQLILHGMGMALVRSELTPDQWTPGGNGLLYFEHYWVLQEQPPMRKAVVDPRTREQHMIVFPRLRFLASKRGAYFPVPSVLHVQPMERTDPLVQKAMTMLVDVISLPGYEEDGQ